MMHTHSEYSNLQNYIYVGLHVALHFLLIQPAEQQRSFLASYHLTLWSFFC